MTALDFRFHHITLQVKQIRYTFLAECLAHTVTPSSSRPYIKRNFEYVITSHNNSPFFCKIRHFLTYITMIWFSEDSRQFGFNISQNVTSSILLPRFMNTSRKIGLSLLYHGKPWSTLLLNYMANTSLIFMATPIVDLKFIFQSTCTPEQLLGYMPV